MVMNTDGRIIDKGFHTGHEVNCVTIPEHDYEYLKYKSRLVEEYESMISRIQNKNRCYREALEFYADEENWIATVTSIGDFPCEVEKDQGEKARKALEESE